MHSIGARYRKIVLTMLIGSLLFPTWGQSEAMPSSDDEFLNDSNVPVIEGEGMTYTVNAEAEHSVTIDREEISASRAPDLLTLLRDSAALSVINYGGYGTISSISLRGFSGDRVTVEIDGIRMNSPQSGDFSLNSINPLSIEKIEIVYSGAPGGVVKITTIKDKPKGFQLNAGFSNTAQLPPWDTGSLADAQRLTLNLGVSGKSFNASLDTFLTSAANRFLFEDSSGQLRLRDGNAIRDGGAAARFSIELPSWSRLMVSTDLYLADKHVSGPVDSLSAGTQQDKSLREAIHLDIARVGTDRLGTTVVLGHSYQELHWQDETSTAAHKTSIVDLSNSWDYFANKALSLAAGTNWQLARLDSTQLGRVTRVSGAADLAVNVQPFRGFALQPKLEFKIGTEPLSVIPLPSLFISKQLSTNGELKIGVSRIWKEPDLNDLYWSADSFATGNPDLESESGWNANLTFLHQKAGQYRAEHSLYGSWYTNAILWQVHDSLWQPENAGEALYLGMDHRLTFENANGPDLTLSYAFLFTRLLTGELDLADGKEMPYQPMHRLTVRISDTVQGFNWHLAPRYEGRRFITTANISSLPPVFLVDGGISAKIGKNTECSLDVHNLFGDSYQLMDGYPMPGLTVSAGVTIQINKGKP